MTRDNVVFTVCGFLLGILIGGFVIGPRVAQKTAAAAPAATPSEEPAASMPASSPAAPASPAAAGAQGSPMGQVMQQLAELKATVERDPKNFAALVQLGNLYMDAAKFPQAIDYYERALAVRNDPSVRTDLGICYRQANQLEKALAAFHQAGADAPAQWQARFNEAIVLHALGRKSEAQAVAAGLAKERPGDADVEKLVASVAK